MDTVVTPVNIKTRQNLDMKTGDTVRVWQKIQEKGKTRLQAFEGLVLARKHGTEAGATFTVRRNTGGYGVEKIFPLYSPMIDKIEILKRSKTRKSKLYYVREKALKEVSKRFKMIFMSHSTEDLDESEKGEENSEKNEIKEEVTKSLDEARDESKDSETPAEETKEKIQETPLEESKEPKKEKEEE
jgi:large subunit ribosomal protein L19